MLWYTYSPRSNLTALSSILHFVCTRVGRSGTSNLQISYIFFLYSERYYENEENRRSFFVEFAKSKSFDPLNAEDWYSVSIREIKTLKVAEVSISPSVILIIYIHKSSTHIRPYLHRLTKVLIRGHVPCCYTIGVYRTHYATYSQISACRSSSFLILVCTTTSQNIYVYKRLIFSL